MQAQYFHYEIIETAPLSKLEEFKDHRRLRVFYEKGCKCVNCEIEATQLALGEGRGQLHWDLYTDDFYPLTVDHIIPKSKGGTDDIGNLQPMCCLCNWKKGNGDISYPARSQYRLKNAGDRKMFNRNFIKDPSQYYIGQEVYRKKNKRPEYLGPIEKIEVNPHTNKLAVIIKGWPHSWYHFDSIYIKQN